MAKIIGTDRDSRCMLCNSKSYGFGCPYSSHRRHVHSDDPKRCVYCGSRSFGVGCPYNPFSRYHIHGIEYNAMMQESCHRSLIAGLFLHRLTQPITETAAFKMGLIDEEGNRIKAPESPEERQALTPLDVYILRLRRAVSPEKIDLLNASVIMELTSQTSDDTIFNEEKFKKEIELKSESEYLVKEFIRIIGKAHKQGLPLAHIENIFLEVLLNKGT